MICRLCIEEKTDALQLFDDEGINLNISTILQKYFWFEINENDAVSTAICNSCWSKVYDFHTFYQFVEHAQTKLSKLVKTEHCEQFEEPFVNEISPEYYAKDDHLNEITINSINNDDLSNIEDDRFQCNMASDSSDDDDPLIMLVESKSINKIKTGNKGIVDTIKHEPFCEDNNDSVVKESNKAKTASRKNLSFALTENENDMSLLESVQPKRNRGRPTKNKQKNKPKKASKETKLDYMKGREVDEKISKFMKLICDKCGLEQINFAELVLHLRSIHKVKGYAVCCGKQFFRRNLLRDHIDKHLNPDRFKCNQCERTFAAKSCLSYHILMKHQPDEEKVFECQECHKKFAKEYILDRHRVIHQDRTHLCNFCQKRFPTAQKLSLHVKYVHSNYGTMCDICAKVVIGNAAFKRHQLEHEGVQLPRQQCDICGVWYKNEYILKKHKRSHNDDGKVHKCNECGKISPSRRALLSHQRFMHFAQRAYECSICNKAFKKALTLKEHMTLHTGEVLYSCPHCPKTFNSNSNMYSHRKKAHPKEFEMTRKSRLINGITETNKVLTPTAIPTPVKTEII